MKVLEAFIQARDDAFNEGPEGRLQMPRWLSGSLILLIIINIVAYVAVTWITVAHIDRQIALLQAATATNGTHHLGQKLQPKNEFISLEEDHHTDHDSIAAKIKALESRRSELITGVIIEIALDLVDLTDVFVGNFFIHVIYLVTKLFSIGLWSYSQLEQSNSVIWLLPLCICLLIILVHLRWFTALRKWVLALCIIVSTAAWTAVLFIRCRQIGAHISRLQALNHHLKDEGGDEGEGEKERLKRVIEGEMQNRLILCIGTFLMIIFGSMGLMAECCRAPLVAIVFGVLHSIGFTLWLVKITFFSAQEADVLFCVPLIYAVLTIAIFIVFLFEFYNRFKKGNGKRRNGKSGKGKKKKGNKKKLLYTFVSDDDEEDEDENEDEDDEEDSEQQNNNNLSAKPQKSTKSTAKSSQKTAKMTKTNKTKTKTKTNKTKAKTNRTAKRYSQKHRTLKE